MEVYICDGFFLNLYFRFVSGCYFVLVNILEKMVKSVALALSLATTGFAAPFYTNASSWSGWKNVKELFVL